MPRAKNKTMYFCDACGNESLKWEGRCSACGEWNTMVEVRRDKADGRGASWLAGPAAPAQELSQVSTGELPRLTVSSTEVNRVLGGGLVPGSVVLIAGDPGIGKSTLLLRVAADVCGLNGKTLYVSGEESAAQVKMRADRLGLSGQNLYLLPATSLNDVLDHLDEHRPVLAVVDSIQTIYDESLPSEPGSVAQIRDCTRKLMMWAKSRGVPMVLSGHVTKGGDIAGPRALEHMVDVVLYMEGESLSAWRLLRTVKNRFGSTNEVGILEMTERGLVDVEDPSKTFLSERREGTVGSVIVSTLEGTRPLLAEVQALTTPSALAAPRRIATGIDFNRLLLVCAVLSRRVGLELSSQDIVVNVTGGLKVNEPAADLGLALAIASSYRNAPLAPDAAAIGEVGLSGEVRRVPQLDRRVKEVYRLGLRWCLVPANVGQDPGLDADMEVVSVSSLAEAVSYCIPKERRRPKDAPWPNPV